MDVRSLRSFAVVEPLLALGVCVELVTSCELSSVDPLLRGTHYPANTKGVVVLAWFQYHFEKFTH